MSDGITAELDADALVADLSGGLADASLPYVNAASAVTAAANVAEAKARLQRRLGPNATGATVAGIVSAPARDGVGFIVEAEREPYPNLPFWIEKGTKKGKPGSHTEAPRPFFYVAVELEVGNHERRIAEAQQQMIIDRGYGG